MVTNQCLQGFLKFLSVTGSVTIGNIPTLRRSHVFVQRISRPPLSYPLKDRRMVAMDDSSRRENTGTPKAVPEHRLIPTHAPRERTVPPRSADLQSAVSQNCI